MDRVQFDCLKQGSIDSGSWSARSLTIDLRTRTITISRRSHPEVVLYHSLEPTNVQEWPNFCRETITERFSSAEAKRTVCILGTTAAVPAEREGEAALVGIPLSELQATPSPFSPPPPQAERLSRAAVARRLLGEPERHPFSVDLSRREITGQYDAWTLRFPSKLSRDAAVRMLRAMPGVKFAGDPPSIPGRPRRRHRHVMGVVVSE